MVLIRSPEYTNEGPIANAIRDAIQDGILAREVIRKQFEQVMTVPNRTKEQSS